MARTRKWVACCFAAFAVGCVFAPRMAPASVKPPLECTGVDSWFGQQVLNPVQLSCISWQLVPGANSPANESSAKALIGRRFSVLFEVDTYNTSEDSHWSYDPMTGLVEVDVTGDVFEPNPSRPLTASDAAWWKVGKNAHGLDVRTDYAEAPGDSSLYRAIYLAEVDAKNDPARLGDSPFYARFRATPAAAKQLRENIVLQADGVIVAPSLGPTLHCGDLASSWRNQKPPIRTQSCVFSVQFTHFAFRLAGSGKTLVEWNRPHS